MKNESMETLNIQYNFTFPNGSREIFDIQLNKKNLEARGDLPDPLPPWTNLDFYQCPNCPLDISAHPHCPLAARLVDVVRRFDGVVSYDKIHIDVTTQERTISQDTTAQRGISSLMGLIFATSGCPHTAFFRPMARFHLPLATEKETVYRATSMYLLAQYFLRKEGGEADLELTHLMKIYEDIQVVNFSVVDRVREATKTDSSLNALILLDAYAKTLPFFVEKSLEKLRYMFAPFFPKKESGCEESEPQEM